MLYMAQTKYYMPTETPEGRALLIKVIDNHLSTKKYERDDGKPQPKAEPKKKDIPDVDIDS